LRKEALGFGDIHIIAAAGAVMGPHLAIAGFFLAAPVALLGTLVLVFRKRYRTLPFGPWLSVGFLLALLWSGPLMQQINSAMAALDLILAGGPTRPI
jgi:leader peptidase (prepilin peptidase)/N-methyltransferase